MELKLFNSATRQLEPVRPLDPPHVRMHACGPTVYDYAHIGNFRSFLYEDLLRRALRWFGFTVTHVMNFTDVDDKTIRGAKAAGVPLSEFTEKYTQAFREDMATLHIETQEFQPKATEFIPQMITLIETLIARGHAYSADDGSVYFRLSSYPYYGKLSRVNLEGLQVGARVAQDEYEKESFGDFALWKAWTENDGEVGWESPWGRGRPGWHIECSAMSMHFLGEAFDLHCGGIDLRFPHHENEIAQSECATGKKFVQSWGHCAHLLVEGRKMSKSLGNLYTVREVLSRGYTGRQLRYALIAAHYRQELNFTWEAMEGAKEALRRIDDWRRRWKSTDSAAPQTVPGVQEQAFVLRFKQAIAEDLNISEALGALFDFLRETNRQMDAGEALPSLPAVWSEIDSLLGLGEEVEDVPPDVSKLAAARLQARQSKDWVGSDRLRKEIEALGWTVRDKAGQQELVRK